MVAAHTADESTGIMAGLRRAERVVSTLVLHGRPAFAEGDRVVVMDEAARTVLGDETGVVKAVECPFGGWEYRVVADDPDGWIPNVRPDEGQLLTADEIERYVEDGQEGE